MSKSGLTSSRFQLEFIIIFLISRTKQTSGELLNVQYKTVNWKVPGTHSLNVIPLLWLVNTVCMKVFFKYQQKIGKWINNTS